MNLHDVLAIFGFVISAILLMVYVVVLFRARRRDVGLGQFILGGPLWLLAPKRFFEEPAASFARRGFLWWVVEHVSQYLPTVLEYLDLPPGYRFLVDGANFEDVWFDQALLAV